MKSSLITILAIFLFILSACGRKTDPVAPETNAPQAVSNLKFEPTSAGTRISWLSPSKNVRGKKLDDLESFEIRARIQDTKNSFRRIAVVKIPRADLSEDQSISKRYSYLHSHNSQQDSFEYIVIPINDYGTSGPVSVILRRSSAN